MPIVRIPKDNEISDEVKRIFNTKVKPYMGISTMGPYSRSLSYKPRLLENMGDEHLHIMPNRSLSRKVKEMIATSISMVNNCSFCTISHASVLKAHFDVSDEELIELAQLTAHFNALGNLENSYSVLSEEENVIQPAKSGLLSEINDRLGALPKVYRLMALDPPYLKITWDREKALMDEGLIETVTKRLIALTVLARVNAKELFGVHWALAKKEGVNLEKLFEALHVMHTFQKNNVYTSGIQLKEPSQDWTQSLQQSNP